VAETQTVTAAAFYSYASANPTSWQKIGGQRISHPKFGEGTVQDVAIKDPVDNTSLTVRFDTPVQSAVHGLTDTLSIQPMAASGGMDVTLTVPTRLRELVLGFQRATDEQERLARQAQEDREPQREAEETRERQRELERRQQAERGAEARGDFECRKQKYGVGWFAHSASTSPLNRILLQLDAGEPVSADDCAWLAENKLYAVLAVCYEKAGSLALAASNWRRAGRPERAIEITGSKVAAADPFMLTTRGGAFCDLHDLESAEECARKAIALGPEDCCGYNLLGAICYQRGELEEGDKCFRKAMALGSGQEAVESSIRSALEHAQPANKQKAAQYLLSKDADRYNWVRFYLQ
jgi:tetratricopeptide (TPR) repeat protein